jgi:glycosyltransferase involved in cell wall biosynthesis
MTKTKNDNAHMLIHLQSKNVKMSIIASKSLGLKGKGSVSDFENMDGIAIYRLFKRPFDMFAFPQTQLENCLHVASDLKPDLIFCSQQMNMILALSLQKSLHVPIVLLVEDGGRLRSGEARLPLTFRALMALRGVNSVPNFWNWLCRKASAIITCHPKDIPILHEMSTNCSPVYHLPWPTFVPPEFVFPSQREKFRGIYVGSLSPFKNTQEFEQTLPRILKETYTREFWVIGPGPHSKMIKKLQQKTNGAIKYLPGLSRFEALTLIASSYYAYTPVTIGGWGFIGDCWSVKTPLVMTHNDGYVVDGVNASVAEDLDSLISNINNLYDNPEVMQALQENGLARSEQMNAKSVSDRLYSVFADTLKTADEKIKSKTKSPNFVLNFSSN